MISVLIPVYNEEDILETSAMKVHEYLVLRKIDHEVVVTSNGSTDRTDAIGERLAQEHSWFRFFTLPEKGVGKAFALAAQEAKGDLLVSLDVDLSFDLRFLEYAHDLLQYADAVVGSKTMGKQRRSFLRVVASQVYILCSQLLFGLTISDYSIGCKAYRKSSIIPLLPRLDTWTGYVLEICLALNNQNKRIIQVGVDCDDRRASHFNLLHEGIYRYRHLYRCWRRIKRNDPLFISNP